MSFISLIALFPHDTADYTNLGTWAYTDTMYGILTEKVELTTESLPALGKYKAVLGIPENDSLHILAASEVFDVLQNNATLKTDETQYFEGESIDITVTMAHDAGNMEYEFAWIGVFPQDNPDYSLPPPAVFFVGSWMTGNTGTIPVSSRNMPALNPTYRAVMAVNGSNPLRILGVSDAFDVIQNKAILETDETQYYEGEWIEVTFTMDQEADDMEYNFAWIGLYPENAQNYSLPPAAIEYSNYSPLFQVSSRNLPALNATYKAVMVIADSNPPRILGVSDAFDVLQSNAILETDETQYYEGEWIEISITMNQEDDMEYHCQ
ncbi:hypothetical protein MHU86_5831 [Fragilaria crotonensis]|nr:hypothetical protein MHU86_5831 [Fragilaria crotonensis]